MMKTTKSKSVFSALFAVIMALCLVVGLNAVKLDAKAADETPAATTAWQTSRSKALVELNGSGLQYSGQSATVINKTNLLDVPGRTVTFQFMSSGQEGWAAFMFLNGQSNWHQAVWSGINRDCDTLPHVIVQNGAAQLHANTTAALYGGAAAVGVKGMAASISDQLHTVEVHLGTGEGGDVSTIKIDGVKLFQDGTTDTTILPWLKAGDFTKNGCYLAFHCNQVGSAGGVTLFGEYNAPYVDYSTVSAALNGKIDLSTGVLPAEMTFTAKNVTGAAKLTVNGTEVTDENAYAIADVEGGKKVTIKPAFWNTYIAKITRTTTLTLVAENGKASVYTTVQKAAPPVWKGVNYHELDEVDDVVYTFDYDGAATQDSIVVKTGIRNVTSDALVAGEDYTLTQSGKTYTFTLKKEYLEKQIGAYRSLKFSITIGEDTLEGSLYCKYAEEGWIARPNDLVKDTELVTEGHYVSANLRAFSETTLSSRIYYNKAFDVTKPISLEVEAFGDGTEWALLGVMDSLKLMDYFSNETANDMELTALFFGNGRKDIQKLGGFVATASTNAEYEHLPKIKNLVVEMYFGKNSAEEGYFKVNGQNIATPAALQKDFANGVAYLGFFFNHQNTDFDFKANKDINGIAVTGPVKAADEASFTVDIADPAKDLVLDVINADGAKIKVSSDKGTVAAAEDISYADGKLTIKKSFFKKLPFAKQGQIIIEDENTHTGTAINMTYVSSQMEKAHVAFATKGALEDAKFKLGLNSVEDVMKGDEMLAKTEWSYADGVLTIKKANIANELGATEFIAVADRKLYPLYVYVDSFKDGYAKAGKGTVEKGNGAYMLTGASSLTFMNVYDFVKGVTMKVDFKSTAGYYTNGRNYQAGGYARFDFYDPYSRYTFTYILFTNYDKDSVTANETALYETYYVNDAKGNAIILESSRTVNVSRSENANALGVHNVKFAVVNGNLTITVDNARSTTISDSFGTFNFEASVLKVEIPASAEKNEMKVAVKEYAEGEAVNFEAIDLTEKQPGQPGESQKPGESEKPGEPENPTTSEGGSKKGGCGGSVAVGAVMLPALAAALFIFKKKEDKE